jgi:itaconyl-CoA hydratase
VAGAVADREENRLVLRAGLGERLVAPGVPVDGVGGVLEEVRAGFLREAVHVDEIIPDMTYDELEVGAVYRSRFGRTVLEADNVWFTLLTLNTNPIHFDAEYAATTEWKQPLVDSTFTLALVTGLSVVDVSERGVNLGWREVRLPAPVFAGDTLHAETEILSKRESKSRTGQGIVTVRTRGVNQRDEVVIEFERSIMVPLA